MEVALVATPPTIPSDLPDTLEISLTRSHSEPLASLSHPELKPVPPSEDSPPVPTGSDAIPIEAIPKEEPLPEESKEEEEIIAPESTTEYSVAMKELRFNACEMNDGEEDPADLDTNRVTKEIRTLSRDLPCDSSASMFVRADASRLSHFRALISGVDDTPYAHGLFLFDIHLPQDYPNNPPKMVILTTGNGEARFNPNLYADGYMCLSILNTWSSSPEEQWNPSLGTLLQVFVSVQSLVMDNDVIQKEPGYEYYSTSDPENQTYCDIVKYNNIKYAMTDMIRNPPEEFAEVVRRHFVLKKEQILKDVKTWVENCQEDIREDDDGIISSHNQSTLDIFREVGVKVSMDEAFEELKATLSELE